MFASLRHGMAHEHSLLSSFQALVVSVGGQVGGGITAGVAVAIAKDAPRRLGDVTNA